MSVSLDTLTDKLDSYLDTKQIKLVRDAYYFAADAHEGRKRRSGEAYVTHPLAVADILADMHMDHQREIPKAHWKYKDGRAHFHFWSVSCHQP